MIFLTLTPLVNEFKSNLRPILSGNLNLFNNKNAELVFDKTSQSIPKIALVCEAQTDNNVYQNLLNPLNIDFTSFNVEEVLEISNIKENFDLVIIDSSDLVNLTLSTIREIKNSKNSQNIPIFVCSSKISELGELKFIEAGCDLVLSKPLECEIILFHICRFLELNPSTFV